MDTYIYKPGQQVLELEKQLEQWKDKKPGEYQSPWEGAIQELVQKIQDRKPFSYRPDSDPLYRQAVDRYVRLGREAMMDTMGQAAALTGGYGNSYAQSVGQQAYQKYLLGLSARLPQYQQMALERYQAGSKDLLDRYQVLQQQEKTGFDRYTQEVNAYLGQLDRLQNAYEGEKDRDLHAFTSDRDFRYGQQQDALEAARKAEQARQEQERFQMQQAYQQERDRIRDQQWQRDFDESQRRFGLELQLRQAEAAARAAAAARRGSGGSHRAPAQKPQSRPMNRFDRDQYYTQRRNSRKSQSTTGIARRSYR